MPELPILDPRPLQDLLDMGAGPELVQELVDLLKEDAPPRFATLREALGAGDGAGAVQEAHQLKGALGNLGLQRFADLAARIEAHARAEAFAPALELTALLPAAYEEALAALEAAFPRG